MRKNKSKIGLAVAGLAGGKELLESPGHLIRRCRQIAVLVQQEEFGPYDITPQQFGAMISLVTHPGIDQVTLGKIMAYDQATIGGIVVRLLRKGLIKKKRGEDRRARVLELSAAGQDLIKPLRSAAGRAEQRMMECFSSRERSNFIRLLRQMIAHHSLYQTKGTIAQY